MKLETESFNFYILTLTSFGYFIAFVSVAALFRQISTAIKDRETSVLISLYELSTSKPLSDDFEIIWGMSDVAHKDPKIGESCLRCCLFFEMLGSIVNERYMKTLLIEQYFGSLITGSYFYLNSYIIEQREKEYNNKFCVNFEELSKRISVSARISKPKIARSDFISEMWTGRN